MGPYLAIVRGVIGILNWASQALQQHHDEMNGVTRERATENAASAKVNENVAKAAVDTTDSAALDILRRGGS